MKPLLDMKAASVFFDGIFATPRLAHPEGVAVHADGSVWCGTENGDLLRIAADGFGMTALGTTGGFLLGIAFDSTGHCYACDLRHQAIFRFSPATGRFERFAGAGIKVPNYPIVDEARGALFVSDSLGWNVKGPGIYRYDLNTGSGGLWCHEDFAFANGMAMAPDGSGLFVVQSNAANVVFVPIRADGGPGPMKGVVAATQNVPDGLAFDADGSLFISCYEPSRIYRWKAGGSLELLIEDGTATTLAHPTNMARKGDSLFTANLGRWHISHVDLKRLR